MFLQWNLNHIAISGSHVVGVENTWAVRVTDTTKTDDILAYGRTYM